MIIEGSKGYVWNPSNSIARQGKTNELMVSDAMPRYYDAAVQGNTFFGANQTAATWSVALNTTHTGLVLSNPAGSNKNLILKKVGFALSVAPVAIAHIGLFAGYTSGGITVHTTPITPVCTKLGQPAGVGLVDAAATLVGTVAWAMPLMGGFTAGALPSAGPNIIDLEGAIIIPPGGYVGIGALTAVIGFGGFIWDEVPIS